MRKLWLILLLPVVAHATVYYVRTDGSNGNAGTANTSGGAWLTVDYAADNVSAGDTVRVQAGTYSATVSPGVSGTSGNPITFAADGAVTTDYWDISSRSYLRIIGFTIDADLVGAQDNGCVSISGTCSYLEFWNNTFQDGNYNGIRLGASDQINNSLIIGNDFLNFGVGNGSGVAISIRGADNIIAHNTLTNCHPDGMVMKGDRNRYLNNYTYGFSEASGGHSDIYQTGSDSVGWEQNVIEATFQVGTGEGGDEHTIQVSNSQVSTYGDGVMTENIFRRNIWHNAGSGGGINQASDGDISYTRWYNNNHIEMQRLYPSNTRSLTFLTAGVNNNHVYNNIEYEAWGTSATVNVDVYYSDGSIALDYNLAYDPDGAVSFASPWTSQSNDQSNIDPDFGNVATDDFTISNTGAAYGNAGPLTYVNEPSDTTGTSFDVDDAGFFRGDNTAVSQYSGALVVGDTITIGTDTRTIVSISSNTITVDSSLTWADNDPVYYGDDATPDIGALPYRAGGYSLSGILSSGSPNTVTPSGADLVRWVVWFEDGIPVEVDNASPYQYTDNGGTVTANLYALYPSKSPVVAATPGGSNPRKSLTNRSGSAMGVFP